MKKLQIVYSYGEKLERQNSFNVKVDDNVARLVQNKGCKHGIEELRQGNWFFKDLLAIARGIAAVTSADHFTRCEIIDVTEVEQC